MMTRAAEERLHELELWKSGAEERLQSNEAEVKVVRSRVDEIWWGVLGVLFGVIGILVTMLVEVFRGKVGP
jgi:hypothetical protein